MKNSRYSTSIGELKTKMLRGMPYTLLQLIGFYGELALENWAEQNKFIYKRDFFVEVKTGHINFTTSQKISFFLMLRNKLKIKVANVDYTGNIIFEDIDFKDRRLELNVRDMCKLNLLKIKRRGLGESSEASERWERRKKRITKRIENLTQQEKNEIIENYFEERQKYFWYTHIGKYLKKILNPSSVKHDTKWIYSPEQGWSHEHPRMTRQVDVWIGSKKVEKGLYVTGIHGSVIDGRCSKCNNPFPKSLLKEANMSDDTHLSM